jgi:hypothetical protein
MGQKRHVDVYLLVTIDTFEERLLETLSDKRDLALAALDIESDVKELKLRSNMDDLKRRLETLLGEPAAAPEDRSLKRQVDRQADELLARQQRVATAGGQVVSAVCQLVNELLPAEQAASADAAAVSQVRAGLEGLMGQDEQGRPQLQLTLPDAGSLDQLAAALARLVALAGGTKS